MIKKQYFNHTMKKCLLIVLLLVIGLSGCGNPSDGNNTYATSSNESVENTETKTLTILAAASLTDVTKALASAYEKTDPQLTLVFSYGSSGTLQTQIEEGVRADIFFSAGKKQMDKLIEEDLMIKDATKELLKNELVLIVPKATETTKETVATNTTDATDEAYPLSEANQNRAPYLTSFSDLASEKVKLVALGDPDGVPVGQYSEMVLTNLGILEKVQKKSNYGSDVRQVLTWVEIGEVDCGIVYASDAKTSDKVTVVCEAPIGSHDPIIYPIGIIKQSKNVPEAEAFIEFLSSSEAIKLFEEFGFSRNE